MQPLTEAQVTLGCYATALVLNLVIVVYGLRVARRLGGEGIFAKTASYTSWAALSFGAYNAVALVPQTPAPLLSVLQTVGVCLLAVAAYRLYTLVRAE